MLVAGDRLRAELQSYDVELVQHDLFYVSAQCSDFVARSPEEMEAARLSGESYVDQWANPVRWTVDNGVVFLTSFGPDGRLGTSDDIVWDH